MFSKWSSEHTSFFSLLHQNKIKNESKATYLLLEELYIKLRGTLSLTGYWIATLPANLCFPFSSLLHSLLLHKILPSRVSIISETITFLIREERKHENGHKADLDLLNPAPLEWEHLRKAESYFYILCSYKY